MIAPLSTLTGGCLAAHNLARALSQHRRMRFLVVCGLDESAATKSAGANVSRAALSAFSGLIRNCKKLQIQLIHSFLDPLIYRIISLIHLAMYLCVLYVPKSGRSPWLLKVTFTVHGGLLVNIRGL